jgi:hypothetical protein
MLEREMWKEGGILWSLKRIVREQKERRRGWIKGRLRVGWV